MNYFKVNYNEIQNLQNSAKFNFQLKMLGEKNKKLKVNFKIAFIKKNP